MKHLATGLSLALACGIASPSWAHGVHIQYQLTPDVELQAKFDSGQPMAHAHVDVYAPTAPERPWLTGQADADGRFRFSPQGQKQGTWQVKVRQAGHGAFVNIPVDGTQALATVITASTGGLTGFQRGIGATLVISGCVGTALYLRSRQR